MAREKTFDTDRVLKDAVHLFWERGYEATSVEDLVQALGISRSSLYGTFGGKHELYLAALDHYRRVARRWMTERLDEPGDAREVIRRYVVATVEGLLGDSRRRGCFIANATAERCSYDPAVADRIEESRDAARSGLARVIRRGQERGEIATEHEADVLAAFIVNALYGLRLMTKTRPSRDMLMGVVAVTLSVLE